MVAVVAQGGCALTSGWQRIFPSSHTSTRPPAPTSSLRSRTTAMAALFQYTPADFMEVMSFDGVSSPSFVFPQDHLRCRYASKPCANMRTTKRGGGLHRFCEFHRARANENQWRVDHRRRLKRVMDGTYRPSPRSRLLRDQANELPVLMPDDCPVGWCLHDNQAETLYMSTEEIQFLKQLLFSDEESLPPL